ncbi:MAG: copper resistance D family protein [Vicinamibacterales bacterium]
MNDGFGISPEMLAKAAGYAALLAAAGACSVRWLIAPRLSDTSSGRGLIQSAARVLVLASLSALIAVLIRAWTHTVSAFGFEESLLWENLRLIAFESRWGRGWSWQATAAFLTFLISLGVSMGSKVAWVLATLSAAGFLVAVPLVGHAAGATSRIALHSMHLAGASLWIGTLFVLFVDLRRRGRGTAPFQIFAPVALTGVTTIALSGLIAAALYVHSPAALFGTAYGRALLVKVSLFAAAAAYGFLNWRQMQRVSAGDAAVDSGFGPTVGRELALAAALVLVTGILTELPNPDL